jgi:HEPN domain-containing protein
MPLDPAQIDESAAWFRKARMDLRAAKVDQDADPPLLEDALFHCQQAVEKALKGFLTWHDQPFRKTHSLIELGVQCSELEIGLSELLRIAAKLTEYATKYRYPGEVVVATCEEAAGAFAIAEDTANRVFASLPTEVQARINGGLGL